jgi:uncharacterized lipoprotein YddW (UPF0748 family)
MWVDVFHDGIKSPIQVSQLVQRAKRGGVNALFIQVRSRAQVYHNSIFEPRAPDAMPLFDGLEEVIRLAHAQSPPIQVHCWINAHPLWFSNSEPPWPDHVVLRHPEWLTCDASGNTNTDVGRALDFGNPEAAEYLLRIYLEAVRNYKIDGLHMDFIRYSGTQWGYNAESVKRFFASLSASDREAVLKRSKASATNAEEADPYVGKPQSSTNGALPAQDDPLFCDWRRQQVTSFVRRLAQHAKAIRPDLILSAAVIAWGDAPQSFRESAAYKRCFQDWKQWAENGYVDMLLPMAYFRESQHGAWFRRWIDYCAQLPGKTPIAAGIGNWLNTHDETLTQARYADKRLAGVCFFSYASTNPMPGQEAELFNEGFYTRIGELPLADPPAPKVVRAHTFGYDVSADLSPPNFYLGEPSSRQRAVSDEEAMVLGVSHVQVNRYPREFHRRFIGAEPSMLLGDQTIVSAGPGPYVLADALGRNAFKVAFHEKPDTPFSEGDVVALSGRMEGDVLYASKCRWIGAVPPTEKRSVKKPN